MNHLPWKLFALTLMPHKQAATGPTLCLKVINKGKNNDGHCAPSFQQIPLYYSPAKLLKRGLGLDQLSEADNVPLNTNDPSEEERFIKLMLSFSFLRRYATATELLRELIRPVYGWRRQGVGGEITIIHPTYLLLTDTEPVPLVAGY